MKASLLVLALAATCLFATGCRCGRRHRLAEVHRAGGASAQRFLPLNPSPIIVNVPWSGFFALDSETGQMCRTSAIDIGKEYMTTVPTCSSLYQASEQSKPQTK
ncbi:MAG TPA: hypothetical protein VEF54_02665 [archaeon]|nr:hypothetical protein [archaeon]